VISDRNYGWCPRCVKVVYCPDIDHPREGDHPCPNCSGQIQDFGVAIRDGELVPKGSGGVVDKTEPTYCVACHAWSGDNETGRCTICGDPAFWLVGATDRIEDEKQDPQHMVKLAVKAMERQTQAIEGIAKTVSAMAVEVFGLEVEKKSKSTDLGCKRCHTDTEMGTIFLNRIDKLGRK